MVPNWPDDFGEGEKEPEQPSFFTCLLMTIIVAGLACAFFFFIHWIVKTTA